MSSNIELGKFGETASAAYLESHGFTIVCRNYRSVYGEIDIIASRDISGITEVHFIEVKTRTGSSYGRPLSAITPSKLSHIMNTAVDYAAKNDLNCSLFIDAAEVFARRMQSGFELLGIEFYDNISQASVEN